MNAAARTMQRYIRGWITKVRTDLLDAYEMIKRGAYRRGAAIPRMSQLEWSATRQGLPIIPETDWARN
jgi:hypothetical protein